jgi:hypothetical protein
MKKVKDAEKLAEETMHSIDNIAPADVNDFLFTSIQNRVEARKPSFEFMGLKPMYRVATLLIFFIVVNIISFNYVRSKTKTRGRHNTSNIDAFARDYGLNDNSNNY